MGVAVTAELGFTHIKAPSISVNAANVCFPRFEDHHTDDTRSTVRPTNSQLLYLIEKMQKHYLSKTNDLHEDSELIIFMTPSLNEKGNAKDSAGWARPWQHLMTTAKKHHATLSTEERLHLMDYQAKALSLYSTYKHQLEKRQDNNENTSNITKETLEESKKQIKVEQSTSLQSSEAALISDSQFQEEYKNLSADEYFSEEEKDPGKWDYSTFLFLHIFFPQHLRE
ncbi:uncharacterized protein LOC116416241 [Nasonia vitripennis]|uniref:Uncharacterized protein n=1 Tax=Nasonia vitripennis TaxID=7425 RepID=A0A7M7Q281_NASVI|nr:uncharacterized protein LOC116416241 [Nasonia vitripennis]